MVAASACVSPTRATVGMCESHPCYRRRVAVGGLMVEVEALVDWHNRREDRVGVDVVILAHVREEEKRVCVGATSSSSK